LGEEGAGIRRRKFRRYAVDIVAAKKREEKKTVEKGQAEVPL